jgi:hypothetical protein
MLVQAYERELKRFDAERVLPAWDGLVTSQQAALAQLKVPTMFPTAVKTDREVGRIHIHISFVSSDPGVRELIGFCTAAAKSYSGAGRCCGNGDTRCLI